MYLQYNTANAHTASTAIMPNCVIPVLTLSELFLFSDSVGAVSEVADLKSVAEVGNTLSYSELLSVPVGSFAYEEPCVSSATEFFVGSVTAVLGSAPCV